MMPVHVTAMLILFLFSLFFSFRFLYTELPIVQILPPISLRDYTSIDRVRHSVQGEDVVDGSGKGRDSTQKDP
jgi:hypothetical protein